MKKTLGMATLVAGMVLVGGLSVQAATIAPDEVLQPRERIHLAQMNSPGDGISSGASRTGNGRMRAPRHRGHHRHHRHRR